MTKEPFKYFLERTTPLGKIARLRRQQQLKKKYIKWQRGDTSGPMPNYGKQQEVIGYIKRFRPEVFIETGTYKGKMVYAVMPYIDEIYSIELDDILWERARARFSGYPNIRIIQGQSGEVLPGILEGIDARCLFWLDAHYSGGSTAKGAQQTPIMQELRCIFEHNRASEHVILIDDAGCFVGQNDYPRLEEVRGYVLSTYPGWTFEVKNDIIRIHKRPN